MGYHPFLMAARRRLVDSPCPCGVGVVCKGKFTKKMMGGA